MNDRPTLAGPDTRYSGAALMAIALDIHALLVRIERTCGSGIDDVELGWPLHARAHYVLAVWLRHGFDRHPADEVRARGYIELLSDESDGGVRFALDLLIAQVREPGRERLARRLHDQLLPPADDRLH